MMEIITISTTEITMIMTTETITIMTTVNTSTTIIIGRTSITMIGTTSISVNGTISMKVIMIMIGKISMDIGDHTIWYYTTDPDMEWYYCDIYDQYYKASIICIKSIII